MRLRPYLLIFLISGVVMSGVGAPFIVHAVERVDEAERILAGDPRADRNGDGVTDGRDIQPLVDESLAPEPYSPEWIASLKAHPNYLDVLNSLASFLRWPAAKYSESPEAMIGTVYACAQWEAFTGEWPRASDTLPILRRVRNEWPLPFSNFNHQLTLWHIRTMYTAAKLSPRVRAEYEIPFRWIESRMLEPQLIGKAPTAIYSTSPGSGLRDMVMIREVLYGEESAREVALRGFGSDPTQWGLPRLIDECIDDDGLLRVNVAAFNHWAWTNRVALVWLLEVKGYKRYLTVEQFKKWRKFYELACRMLCAGGKTLTIPGVNDDYSTNPVLGPVSAWTGNTDMDRWARWHARRQSSPSIDWLLVPADPIDYTPPERPPGCSGNRDFGRIRLSEDDAGTLTRIEYLGDGTVIMGGHRAGRAITIEIQKQSVTDSQSTRVP